MNSAAFIIIAIVTLAGALAAATLPKLIHAALCLVVAFVGLAAFFFLLGAEFVGLVQVFVYVGAVAVLIVFTILLTRRDVDKPDKFNWGGVIVAVAVFGGAGVVFGVVDGVVPAVVGVLSNGGWNGSRVAKTWNETVAARSPPRTWKTGVPAADNPRPPEARMGGFGFPLGMACSPSVPPNCCTNVKSCGRRSGSARTSGWRRSPAMTTSRSSKSICSAC